MKRMKCLVLALVLMISAWALAGCGGMSEDEAKEYAQAVLDASYKGEFDSYMELTDSCLLYTSVYTALSDSY